MSVRKVGYREAEDLIRNYAPARYLCGLTESSWSPDFTTIQDFTQLLGPEGMELLNQHTVKQAVEEKLADPKVIVADTTAQEAPIGHPNEMGLMSAFLTAAVAASRKLTGIAPELYQKMLGAWKRGKKKLRSYRLFAKTKEAKNELIAQMAGLVDRAQRQLTRAMEAAAEEKGPVGQVGQDGVVQAGASWPDDGASSAADPVVAQDGQGGDSKESSRCTCRSCTRSCGARWARPWNSVCAGA